MSGLLKGIGILQGDEAHITDLIWLTPVLLVYLFTFSNSTLDFVLGVVAIGGARIINDLLDEIEGIKLGTEMMKAGVSLGDLTELGRDIRRAISKLDFDATGLDAIAAIVYVVAFFRGLSQLAAYFDSTNAILVGIAGLYWGGTVIAILHLYDSNSRWGTLALVAGAILVLVLLLDPVSVHTLPIG